MSVELAAVGLPEPFTPKKIRAPEPPLEPPLAIRVAVPAFVVLRNVVEPALASGEVAPLLVIVLLAAVANSVKVVSPPLLVIVASPALAYQ